MQYGLLGRTLGHSYSPRIHNMLGGYPYELFPVEPEELDDFLQNGSFDGVNVTIPYKKTVIPYCRALSDAARAIGSVNTILRGEDGFLYGDNTDADGFAAMVRGSGISPFGKKALVLGSGGASLTVCHVLKEMGARQVVVISRAGPDNYDNLDRHADGELVVNTTPVGMYPHTEASPVDLRRFPQCQGALDIIYNPARTRFLLQAEELGIPRAGGLTMLVGQAKKAAELFLETQIPESRLAEVVSLLRRETENLILIGMPGCGKTTVGRRLAQGLGRRFVDTDEEIEKEAGCTIPEVFTREGEMGFRARETKVLARLGREGGLVIATGGGCVTRPENLPLLRQNGTLIFLKRDLAKLEREGRPLSQGGDLAAMYRTRLPFYQTFADKTVVNEGDPQQVAERIQEEWK